jgi:hypothetical protein
MMATYHDLPNLMRRATEAAIDNELRRRQWYGDAASGYSSAGYDARLPPVSLSTGDVIIESQPGTATGGVSGGPLPPGAELIGEEQAGGTGDVVYKYRVNPGEDIYGPWFERINAAFEPWHDLPDPAGFDDAVEHVVEAIGQLTFEAGDARPGTVPVAEVDLATLLNSTLAAIKPEQGQVALAFDSAYGAKHTKAVIGNQRELLITLGVALSAEQRAWAEVRKSVVAVAQNAVPAFASASPAPIDFAAVKGFLDAVTGILPAGKVLDVLSKAATTCGFLEEVTPSPPDPQDSYELTGESADEVYDHLILALTRLDTDITDAEQAVRDLTNEAVAKASARHEQSDYHISPGEGVDTSPDGTTVGDVDWSKPGQIDVNVEVYQSVGLRAMPSIAAYLESASDLAGQSGTPASWLRASSVGSGGQYGPYYNGYADFLELITSVLSSSAAEIMAAGELLAIAAGYIGDADDVARKTFDQQAGEISPPEGKPEADDPVGTDDPVSADDLDDDPLGWPAEANPQGPPVYDPNHPVAH